MVDQDLLESYAHNALYGIIVLTTIFLFNFFSKKKLSLGSLIFLVLFPTWFIAATVLGIINRYFDNMYVFSLREFLGLMAETLAPMLVFWGITFTTKYLKHKKYFH